jgi:hypothetical protein
LSYALVTPFEFRIPAVFRNGIAQVQIGERIERPDGTFDMRNVQHALIDAEGSFTHAPGMFSFLHWLNNGVGYAGSHSGESLLIDADGHIIRTLPQDIWINTAHSNAERIIAVWFGNESLVGVFDYAGRQILPPSYRRVSAFSGGYAVAAHNCTVSHLNRRWGIIDNEGIETVAPRYNASYGITYGLAVMRSDEVFPTGRWGAIDMYGNEIIPFIYIDMYPFSNGLAMVSRNWSEVGFINIAGEVEIPFTLTGARSFSEGLAAARVDDRALTPHPTLPNTHYARSAWGFIDRYGRFVVEPQFDIVRDFKNGMAAVGNFNEDGILQWGFVNTAGDVVLPPVYHWVQDFDGGYAVVNLNGEVHLPNWAFHPMYMGNPEFSAVPFSWDTVSPLGGSNAVIDRWGRLVMGLGDFDAVGQLSEGMLAVNQGRVYIGGPGELAVLEEGLWGFIRLIEK